MQDTITDLQTSGQNLLKALARMFEGTKEKSWRGYENGNGEEVGTEIDRAIKELKRAIKLAERRKPASAELIQENINGQTIEQFEILKQQYAALTEGEHDWIYGSLVIKLENGWKIYFSVQEYSANISGKDANDKEPGEKVKTKIVYGIVPILVPPG